MHNSCSIPPFFCILFAGHITALCVERAKQKNIESRAYLVRLRGLRTHLLCMCELCRAGCIIPGKTYSRSIYNANIHKAADEFLQLFTKVGIKFNSRPPSERLSHLGWSAILALESWSLARFANAGAALMVRWLSSGSSRAPHSQQKQIYE